MLGGDSMETDPKPGIYREEVPRIFDIQFMPSDVQAQFMQILDGATVGGVFNAFSEYIRDFIEPLGWKAIWKPTRSAFEFPKETSFKVNVVDVYWETLEASVVNMGLIHPHRSAMTRDDYYNKIQPWENKPEAFRVPLIDLFVICESNEDPEEESEFYNTAYLIGLLRFFYQNIWRPWDDIEAKDQDELFVPNFLMRRLALLWEMKNNLISSGFNRRFNTIIKEAVEVREKMNEFNKKLEAQEDTDSEKEAEDIVNELDASEYLRWKLQLQEYEREMNIIEDPDTRGLYHTLMPDKMANEEAESAGPCIHLVSKSQTFNSLYALMEKLGFSLGMTKERYNWPTKMHHSLQKAISCSKSGDAIYLSSGVYNEPLGWLEKDIDIIGMDDEVQLLSNKDAGDVFLFIDCSKTVKLANLTIRATNQLNHLIVVKRGKLQLDRVQLDCNNLTAEKAILIVAKTGSLEKKFTEVINNFSQHD